MVKRLSESQLRTLVRLHEKYCRVCGMEASVHAPVEAYWEDDDDYVGAHYDDPQPDPQPNGFLWKALGMGGAYDEVVDKDKK